MTTAGPLRPVANDCFGVMFFWIAFPIFLFVRRKDR